MRIKTESSDEHLPPVPESVAVVQKYCTGATENVLVPAHYKAHPHMWKSPL